jgi:ribosomal protein L32
MLGIGLGKLFLLLLLILVIWYGFKFVNRAEQVRQTFQRAAREAAERGQARNQARDQRRTRARRGDTAIKAEDMIKCSVCGVYVTASGATNCGKPNCPW